VREISHGKYTKILVMDEPGAGGACHKYQVYKESEPQTPLCYIAFQEGPIKEAGINGAQNEDLIKICMDRIAGFQSGKFSCPENAEALKYLTQALDALSMRTKARESQGVEGTHELHKSYEA